MQSSASLKMVRKNKISQVNTYKKRKKEIEHPISAIEQKLSFKISDVTLNIKGCGVNFSAGLLGTEIDKISTIESEIDELEEKDINSDRTMSAFMERLREEANRCQRKIDGLEEEISNLDRKIFVTEANESKERANGKITEWQGRYRDMPLLK